MVAIGDRKVFVAHRATGVHLIPEGWLDAWRPSGFREATPGEVMGWYDDRGVLAPPEMLRDLAALASDCTDADGDDRDHRRQPITLLEDGLAQPQAPPMASAAGLPTRRALP